MITFIKANNLKKSDYQTDIDKYRVAENITDHRITLKWYGHTDSVIINKLLRINIMLKESSRKVWNWWDNSNMPELTTRIIRFERTSMIIEKTSQFSIKPQTIK